MDPVKSRSKVNIKVSILIFYDYILNVLKNKNIWVFKIYIIIFKIKTLKMKIRLFEFYYKYKILKTLKPKWCNPSKLLNFQYYF